MKMAPYPQKRMSQTQTILVRDLNPYITCSLCRGYFVDATSLVDCLHVFCRACILRYFENSKLACPTCNILYKKKSNPCFRSDTMIQSLVYKLIPGLYGKEVQRREDFYRSTGVRASSSCSEDSVLGDISEEHEEWILSTGGDQNQYLSPDDAISLSLEYYQPHLDETETRPSDTKSTNAQDCDDNANNNNNNNNNKNGSDLNDSAKSSAEKSCDNSDKGEIAKQPESASEKDKEVVEVVESKGDRRYLQCSAAVTMSLLQKFLRMKHALSVEHRVDIIHSGEVLPPYFSLMDVAYTFNWDRIKPMRFFYRIFTPVKIQPIKIITTSSMGGKQMQVVPAKPNPNPAPALADTKAEESLLKSESDAQNYRNKERLMANLQLQSKAKLLEKTEPAWKEEAKPVWKEEKKPVLKEEKKPVLKEEKKPVLKEEKKPVWKEEKKPVLKEEKKTVSKEEKKPVWKEEKKPVSKEEKNPVWKEEKHPVGKEEKKPVWKEEKKPVWKEEKKPVWKEEKKAVWKEEKKAVWKEEKKAVWKEEKKAVWKEEKKAVWKEEKKPAWKEEKKEDRKSEPRKEKREEEEPVCVYEYEEPDKEDLRAFAEKRDREWALQKQMDEEKEKHRTSKKRKKSKHSKGNLLYKKRKLHAEITSSEERDESLKLKLKVTTPPNGYKHKHHRSYQSHEEKPKVELSSKEKLLQMRQVRHKPAVEEKKVQHNNNEQTEAKAVEEKKAEEVCRLPEPVKPSEEARKLPESPQEMKKPDVPLKKPEVPRKPESAMSSKATQSTVEAAKLVNKEPVPAVKTLRSDFSNKTTATKEICMQKTATVHLERNEQTERQAQRTFLKTFQPGTEKVTPKPRPNTYPGRNHMASKSLEQKIANLHQQYTTVEHKPGQIVQQTKKETPQILNSQYSAFTVSKVEAGAKRKLNSEERHDKRPSLEITLINPQPDKTPVKRPPPPTIPLERIKKSMHSRVSGLSITPKFPDRCDNTGALDLTAKTSRSAESGEVKNKLLNGLSFRPGMQPDKNSIQLSNLQMLSKVALEHQSINKAPGPLKRPPLPNLHTIKIPVVAPQSTAALPKPNLSKLPKLNEINKNQFRLLNPQMRNMRPNQNQSVRNIPNPSLLVRQQNQNRMNSLSAPQSSESKEPSKPNEETLAPKTEEKALVKEDESAKQNQTAETSA